MTLISLELSHTFLPSVEIAIASIGGVTCAAGAAWAAIRSPGAVAAGATRAIGGVVVTLLDSSFGRPPCLFHRQRSFPMFLLQSQ